MYARSAGIDGIEIDLRATKDNYLICHHDPTLKRIYGLNLVISEHDFNDLKGATANFKDQISTFEEIIVAAGNMYVSIELKSPGSERILIEELKNFPEVNILDIASFNVNTLINYRLLGGKSKIRYNISWKKFFSGVFTAKSINADYAGLRTYNLYFPINLLIARLIKQPVSLDPVNKKWQAKLAKIFVPDPILIGDDPERLKNW